MFPIRNQYASNIDFSFPNETFSAELMWKKSAPVDHYSQMMKIVFMSVAGTEIRQELNFQKNSIVYIIESEKVWLENEKYIFKVLD